jgi:hypothetical protein
MQKRPTATLLQRREYLWKVAGLKVGASTVDRILRSTAVFSVVDPHGMMHA